MKILAGKLLAAILAPAPGGCMVGPDYRRLTVAVAAHCKELPGWQQAEPAAAGLKGQWWTAFHGPLLDRLESTVSVSNQTVRQDYANYRQAVAEVAVAHAALFPSIGLSGAASRQRGTGAAGVVNAGMTVPCRR